MNCSQPIIKFNLFLAFIIITASFFFGIPSASADISTGLVSHWKLDETTGTIADDSVGTSNGTLTNGPAWTTGKISNGLSFDGTDDQITLTSSSLSLTSAVSVSAWIYSVGTADDLKILVSGARVGTPYYEYAFVRRNTNQLALGLSTTAGQSETASVGTIPTNTWTHVVGTWDGSNIRLYINGVMDSGSPITKTGTIVEQNNNFHIGTYNNAQFWNGKMDDVRVYNRALSSADITELYNYTGASQSSSAASSFNSSSQILPPSSSSSVQPAPAATTNSATGITSISATLNAIVNNNGLTTTAYFEYGLTTAYGNTTPVQTVSDLGSIAISSSVSGLSSNTVYYYRAAAFNNGGTTYGTQMSFTTANPPPQSSSSQAKTSINQWKQVVKRTQAQKTAGLSGGEGWQRITFISYAPSNPNIVYFATDTNQIWKSIDGGVSWQRKGNFPIKSGMSFTVSSTDPNVVQVAGSNQAPWGDRAGSVEGIARTTDGGDTWAIVKTAHFHFGYDYGKHITYAGASTLYAAPSTGGILKSTDNGATWNLLNKSGGGNVLDTLNLYNITVHPTNKTILFASATNGLHKIIDTAGSATVTKIGAGLPAGAVYQLQIDSNTPNTMYIPAGTNGVYRSTDGGLNFSARNNGLSNPISLGFSPRILAISPVNSNRLFVTFKGSFGKYLYYTNDGGANWTQTSNMDEENADGWVAGSIFGWTTDLSGIMGAAPIAFHPTNQDIALTSGYGDQIKKTTDGGVTWKYSNTGYTGSAAGQISSVTPIAWDATNANRAVYSHADFGSLITENSEDTFRYIATVAYNNRKATTAVALRGSIIVEAVGATNDSSTTSNILAVSRDSGSSWAIISGTESNYHFISFHPQNSNIVYAEQYKFTDIQNTNTYTTLTRQVTGIFKGNGNIVYSNGGIGAGTISKSTNGGSTWTTPYPSLNLPTGFAVAQIAIDPDNENRIYAAVAGKGIYIITDTVANGGVVTLKNDVHGITKDSTGSIGVISVTVDPNNSNVVYASTNIATIGIANGVFRSTDRGETWTNINGNIGAYLNTFSVIVNPFNSYVYVNSFAGTWKLPPPGIVSPPQSSSSATQSSFSIQSSSSSSLPSSSSSSATLPALSTTAKKTLSNITVDGNLNESVWNLTDSINRTISGVNNNATTFSTLWDSKYLYVGVKVLDSVLKNDSTNPWQDDSVEIYIDGGHNHSTTYDTNDRHIIKGQGDSTAISYQLNTPNLIHGWSSITGGYTAEFAIPWSDLNITPSANMTIGFDLQQNDDDNGADREGFLSWSDTTGLNPGTTVKYGHLILSATTVGTSPSSSSSSVQSSSSSSVPRSSSSFSSSSSSSSRPSSSSSVSTTNKFAIGDRIITTDNLHVRSSASLTGTLLGTHPIASLGTVVSGPVSSGGYNWYNINFDSAPDGWSVENYLEKTVQSSSSSVSTGSSSSVSQSALSNTSGGGGSGGGGGGGGGIFNPSYSYESTLKPAASSTATSTVAASPDASAEPFSAFKTAFQPIIQTFTPLFTQPLYLGIRSAQVKTLQERLSQDKTIYPERLVTGYFGPLTKEALKRFQAKHNLEATGLADIRTRNKLNEVYGSSSSATSPSTTATTTKYSSLTESQKQELIKQLQGTLKKLLEQLIELLKKKRGV